MWSSLSLNVIFKLVGSSGHAEVVLTLRGCEEAQSQTCSEKHKRHFTQRIHQYHVHKHVPLNECTQLRKERLNPNAHAQLSDEW